MNRRFYLLFISILLTFSCYSLQAEGNRENIFNENEFAVSVINKTLFDIEIIDSSRIISHTSEKRFYLPTYHNELQDGYAVNYRVPLLNDVFVPYRRNENIIINAGQKTAVIESADFTASDSFIIVENTTNQTISVKNNADYMNNLARGAPQRQYGTPYIKPKEKSVYDSISAKAVLFIEADQYKSIPFPLNSFKPGFVYSFTFDGTSVSLTDARPLRRIGEKGWTKTETRDNNTEIAATLRTADGNSLMLGSEKKNPDARTAIIQKKTDTGSLVWDAPRSIRRDSSFVYITSAAYNTKAKSYLAGGGADMQGIFYENYSAYLRAFDDTGKTLWELGPDDFDANCGPVKSVAYDAKSDVWRFCGTLLDESGSYTGTVQTDGGKNTVKLVTSFEGLSLYALQSADDGSFFVAGKEMKANGDIQAIVQKYDANGRRVWQMANQVKSPSYYQSAFLDAESGQLVLGGTLGGKAFLQGINTGTGKEMWLTLLDYAEVNKTAIVTAIERAPEYGFLLSLCAVGGGEPAAPFVTARVGERGGL